MVVPGMIMDHFSKNLQEISFHISYEYEIAYGFNYPGGGVYLYNFFINYYIRFGWVLIYAWESVDSTVVMTKYPYIHECSF